MADGVVQLGADGTGKKVDNEELTVGVNTVYRQRTQTVGRNSAEIQAVTNTTPGSGDYGAVVRPIIAAAQLGHVGSTTDAEATGDGSVIAILKRLRTVLGGTLTVGAHSITVLNTSDVVVKPGDSVNNAIRVNMVAGGGSGGTSLADKGGFTEGTSVATPISGVYNETISADPSEDQAVAIRSTIKRALHSNLRDSSGNEIGSATANPATGTRGLIVRPIGFVTPAGDTMVNDTNDTLKVEIVSDLAGSTVDTEDDSIAVGQSNVAVACALTMGSDGSNWKRIKQTSAALWMAASPINPSTGLALQTALINVATSGDQTIVSATAAQVITVYGIEYFCNAANNITVKSASTTLLNVQNFGANQGVIRDLQPNPWFVCGTNEAFILNLSASQQVSGKVWYTKG